MYLLQRSLRLNGTDIRGAIGWATNITEHVNQVTGTQVSLWNKVYSRGVGTLVFVAPAPDYTALEGFNDKLMADERYHDLLEQGRHYIIAGSVDDRLSQTLHPADAGTAPTGEYAVVVQTTCANGCLAEGLGVGVELAQRLAEITGVTTYFHSDDGGDFGAVSWVTLYADAAEMERAGQAQFGNASFMELIDKKAGRVYTNIPSASSQSTYRRIM
jgi:hypothetical protein